EKQLLDHCKKMDDLFFGLNINDIRRLAFEFAESNKISHRFDTEVKMAGRDWLASFLDIMNYAFVNLSNARDNGIIMLTLPPHSSHKIQPLDRSIFSPLKTKYAIECDKWMT
ncbi:hypothetical protein ALC57_11260, partial [Trachymyrmex cornetzi]